MPIQALYQKTPITLLLLALIIANFGVQLLIGVSPDNPTAQDLLKFGANFLPLTVNGEAWRLLSAGFTHNGIMHLLFNSFALYYFGQVAEMMLGKLKFLALFLLAVIGGNILSATYSFYQFLQTGGGVAISVGASGGIMGIGAALIALSFSRHAFARHLNKQSLFFVMAINLVMGFAIQGIDNAGHIGGALTGLFLGLWFGFLPKYSKLGVVMVALGLLAMFWSLKQHIASDLAFLLN